MKSSFKIICLFLFCALIPASVYASKDDDDLLVSSFEFYFSRKSLSFDLIGDGSMIRVATVETQQTNSGYYSDNKYVVTKESSSHTLGALGVHGRIISNDSGSWWRPMTNFEVDLLLDTSFEYFQSRFLWDIGFIWNPIRYFTVGPAVGLSYSYFGSNMIITSEPDYGEEVGTKNDMYVLKDGKTNQIYLLTIGPHNIGGYLGLYLDYSGLRFVKISGAALAFVFDVPFTSSGPINNMTGSGRSLSTKGMNNWNDLNAFMLDAKLTFALERLGIDFTVPIMVGYKVFKYPSLALTEQGLYFGVSLSN